LAIQMRALTAEKRSPGEAESKGVTPARLIPIPCYT
jgi:hypothetical protein